MSVTVPRELVSPVRVVEPVMPDTVQTPLTDTVERTAPFEPTTVTVADPLMPLFDTRLAIDRELTFTVVRLDTVIESDCDAVRFPVSVTDTVNPKLPTPVGVPEIVPAADIVTPGGRAPAVIDHDFVPEPPVEMSTVSYADPCTAFGSVTVEIARAATTTIDSERVAVRTGVPPSVTVNVTTDDPAAIGVPDTTPVDGLIDRPTGSPVADQVYEPAPPIAAIVALYTLLTVPSGMDDVVIDTGATTTSVKVWSAVRPPASLTRTVNEYEPAVATLPDSTPPVDSVAPTGREPLKTDQVLVPEPPVAARVNEKAEPVIAEFKVLVVT